MITKITILVIILIFIFLIIILLKFNVVHIEPINRRNIKVKDENGCHKIYIANKDGITTTSRKYHKPDILYYINIYPNNPDKLIRIFTGTFIATSATMAMSGRSPMDIITMATISSLITSLLTLR